MSIHCLLDTHSCMHTDCNGAPPLAYTRLSPYTPTRRRSRAVCIPRHKPAFRGRKCRCVCEAAAVLLQRRRRTACGAWKDHAVSA
eukprot:4178135-Prymnesium_polylepis.2